MEAVLQRIYAMEPCRAALDTYLKDGDIDALGPRDHTLLAAAIHIFLANPFSSLKNIDALLQRGADPHVGGSFAIAASFSNNLGLVKLIVGAPKFNPKYLYIHSMIDVVDHYLVFLNFLYRYVLSDGVAFVLKTLVPRRPWPLPSVLLKSLSPADRLLFESLVAEETQAPHHVRCVFFNQESSAERLPTAVAQHVSSFLLRPAAELQALGDYKRLFHF